MHHSSLDLDRKGFILPSVVALILVVGFVLFIWFTGSSNVVTPAGYVGYIIQRPVFGSAHFVKVQVGPTSTGLHWRYDGENISVTPYTYTEEFSGRDAILARDKLPISFRAHLVFKINHERVKEFMEIYGGLNEKQNPDKIAEEAYKNFVKEPFRTLCRAAVSEHDGLQVNEKINEIGKEIDTQIKQSLESTPFLALQVIIGNAQPPETVIAEISRKVGATQELARKQTEQEIADKDKLIQQSKGEALGNYELEIAKKKREAIDKITQGLTPAYLQYQANEAMSKAAEHGSTIYVPTGGGGLPLILPAQTEKSAPAASSVR